MPPKKRNMLSEDAAVTNPQKKKAKQSGTEDSEGNTTRRGGRSKNFTVPDPIASLRGTESAKAQGKKISTQKAIVEEFIPREEGRDLQHERVVFVDNNTGEAKFVLYRNTEKAEPMSQLWAQFLQGCQSARDHIGADTLGSLLSDKEMASINLKNNASIFPTLITSKGGLRSKDNLAASTNIAQRSVGGTFARATAAATSSDILRSC